MAERDANRSVIGPGVETEGTLRSKGDVTVDGTMNGHLIAQGDVIVSKSGRVNGDLEIQSIHVDGTIKGPIVASKRVVLSQTCDIESLVVSPSLKVEPGARLLGTFCVTPDVAERERALGGQMTVKQNPKPQKVSFKFVGKDAKVVGLFGDFNQWDEKKPLPLSASNGAWTLDLELPPGRYEYLFLVDGEHCPDPNNSEKKKNEYGGENSVMHVS
ncbi:MAG: polymer-forming cytoskeletal protein [Candidatus Hinthialibacter antarcticus]|nr:polymer-forming cytoskeletal protein [Candidatus Hinthialibacter antarcticus]